VPADRAAFHQKILQWYSRPSRLPLANRGHSFRNVWGAWDMHGLVWEWVSDYNALMICGESRQDAAGVDRQLFCAAGTLGSANPSDYAAFMRYAMRSSVKARYAIQNMGFRCAKDLIPGQEPTS
jgi:formylglycine-generating enzyme required for sulfatase activity